MNYNFRFPKLIAAKLAKKICLITYNLYKFMKKLTFLILKIIFSHFFFQHKVL